MGCKEWLSEKIGDQEVHLCEMVRDAAKQAGYSKKELRKAREELGVKTFHQFDEDGATENWFWYLEGQDAGKRD